MESYKIENAVKSLLELPSNRLLVQQDNKVEVWTIINNLASAVKTTIDVTSDYTGYCLYKNEYLVFEDGEKIKMYKLTPDENTVFNSISCTVSRKGLTLFIHSIKSIYMFFYLHKD